MQKTTPILHGQYYHIYNCGINGVNLFREEMNYNHFLKLYDKYIEPVAETYAWCLMPNHFHLLVRVKENIVYKYSKASYDDRSVDAVMFEEVKWQTVDLSSSAGHDSVNNETEIPQRQGSVKLPDATQHFKHFFNAYAKYINKKHNRHGSLFERPFKRKLIESGVYLKQVLVYIHNNAVHHGFCEHPFEYSWSSYHTCISTGKTKINREEVLEWFGDVENFKYVHDKKADLTLIENWLMEE